MDLGSLATSVLSLFNGVVTLGGVTLSGLATPEQMPWGGAQRTVVHRLPGGARIIDLMGQDDHDITWSGYLQGPLASSQARTLDALRIAGAPVQLSWPGFTRTVIVSEFTCKSAWGGYMLPYSVKCIVVPTPLAPPTPSLLAQLTNDVGNALGVPSLLQTTTSVLTTAQNAVQSVSNLLPVVGVLTRGSPAFVSLTSAVIGAQSAISTGLGVTQTAMNGLMNGAALTGTPLGTASPVTAIAALQNALTQTTSLAGLQQMAGAVNRVASNITNAVA